MKPWFSHFKPIAWQGWLVYAAAIVGLIYDFIVVERISGSAGETIFNFFPHLAIMFLLVALIIRARRENA